MLRNYLKVAFRNLWRRKGYSLLNITGLAIGMASAILILLWISNEISYDRFHKNKDYIYQAWNRGVFDSKLQCWESTPTVLGPTMQLEFPEVSAVTRISGRWFVTVVGEKKVSSRSIITDPAFLKMFSFPLVQGNANTALDGIYSILVTQKMAKKMFGSEDVINRVITIDSNNYTVTGVLKDLPLNTAFEFEFILPWSFMKRTGNESLSWGNNNVTTYVQLKPNTNIAAFGEKIKDITIRHSQGQEDHEVFLHPLTKMHLYSKFENGKVIGGRIETIRLFMIIAAFILLIACINFMNLTTARSEKRAKEVGIRKVAGANKRSLIGQFLGESLLISIISGVVALILVELTLPFFTPLVNKALFVPYGNLYFWLAAVAFILFTGFLAGSYPAFFLSSFNPVSVLKGTFRRAFEAVNPRKILVVLQFSFAIILIISTFIILQQIRYAQERETGFERGRLVYHWITGELYEKYPLFKNELIASGVATDVTKTNSPLTSAISDTWEVSWKGKDPNAKLDFTIFTQDEGLIKTAGLRLIQGRDIDLKKFATDSNAMIINESAAKTMGFDNDAVGQIIKENGNEFHVVGVIKDFVMGSPFDHTRPLLIEGSLQNWFNVINIRLSDNKSIPESIAVIEKLFKKYNPAYPFENHFTDEDYAMKFAETQRTARLTGLFAVLTIFISCLGLFGLATYMAETRIKEIGVRKVLGASVLRITGLLSKDFLKLVGIAILIAIPVAWYAMHTWLQAYPYRVQLQWWVFVMAGVLSILISFITVSYQSIKAATANPVKSLRSE